ncbi:MAG: GNAT family N-acetyltransferase [Arenicella sp.]
MDIIYKTQHISHNELVEACDLVNQGGQLSIVLNEERLRETYFLVIALSQKKVVGVSCIKKYNDIAEIGYTAVCPTHRRQKIGQHMTMMLIDHASKVNISVLCGIVHYANSANRRKLEKLGFLKVSEFLSRSGDTTLCWYAHPLSETESQLRLLMQAFIQMREKHRGVQRKPS